MENDKKREISKHYVPTVPFNNGCRVHGFHLPHTARNLLPQKFEQWVTTEVHEWEQRGVIL